MPRTPALPADRDISPDGRRELPPGAHVVTPRGGYVHHGIYVGNGRVVHYGGLVRGLRAGPIEAVSMEHFTQGRPLRALLEGSSSFSSAEIVQRALSRVGEDRYHVLTNNCEHFCEWCVRASIEATRLTGGFPGRCRRWKQRPMWRFPCGAREPDRWRERSG